MNIRRYGLFDIEGVVNVCKEFAGISTIASIPFVFDDCVDFMASHLENERFVQNILVDNSGKVVGVCAFYVSHPPFNKDVLMASEVWWYVYPEYRKGTWSIRLLNKTIDECKELGCKILSMTLEEHLDKRMHDLYARLGFSPKESTYMMECE